MELVGTTGPGPVARVRHGAARTSGPRATRPDTRTSHPVLLAGDGRCNERLDGKADEFGAAHVPNAPRRARASDSDVLTDDDDSLFFEDKPRYLSMLHGDGGAAPRVMVGPCQICSRTTAPRGEGERRGAPSASLRSALALFVAGTRFTPIFSAIPSCTPTPVWPRLAQEWRYLRSNSCPAMCKHRCPKTADDTLVEP